MITFNRCSEERTCVMILFTNLQSHPHSTLLCTLYNGFTYIFYYRQLSIHPSINKYIRFLISLQVTGTATEKQIMETLKRYTTRPSYFQKCLYHLFREMPDVTDARSDIIKVCLLMNHSFLSFFLYVLYLLIKH